MNSKLRKTILETSYKAGACHLGSALSCVDIIDEIYTKKKKDDLFIFSKASGVSALYVVLAKNGIIPENKVAYYLKKYPLASKEVPGVIHSVGSIAHGLNIACGIALGDRTKKIYCLVSDGEMDEGSTWEAAMFASHHKLNNLVVIVDKNLYQACGSTKEILNIEPLFEKWVAFGWQVIEIDGHQESSLKNTLKEIPRKENKPTCIIANTVKGKGVDFMENSVDWHYFNITEDLLQKALCQI